MHLGGATIVSNEYDETTQKGAITFNKEVTEIGDRAFNACYDLISIIIPEGVTRIGDFCFYDCGYLQTIVIPESVIYIGGYCFGGTSLKNFTVHGGLYIDSYAFSVSGLETLIFLDGVTEIGHWAFCECFLLTTVILSNSITEIGVGAFAYCESLSSITIPDSVTLIGSAAFQSCSSLSSITIGGGINYIYDDAFVGCTSLPVEGGIRYADNYLIEVVDKTLSSYIIKDGTRWIGLNCDLMENQNIFSGCNSLTSITIPDSVEFICRDAFRSCMSLSSVFIGNGVKKIGSFAFEKCYLDVITCMASVAPSIESYTFYNMYSEGILKYPSGSDYSSWLQTDRYYLGYYNWTGQEI